MTLKKDELIKAIQQAAKNQIKPTQTAPVLYQVEAVLAALAEVLTSELMDIRKIPDNTLVVPGLGKFGLAFREARSGRNPQTGEALEIAARWTVTFKPCKALLDAANG